MNSPAVRVVGAILFAATGFLYLTSGLLAPLWGVAVLWVMAVAVMVVVASRVVAMPPPLWWVVLLVMVVWWRVRVPVV